ncbi:MAG: ATP synthase F1 subunit delta [Candidatus Paceibacterota bacterium]|jgi:F-type H+-transporting ATPase subunit delta
MATISNNDIAQAIYLSSKDKSPHELSLVLKDVVNFLHRKRLLNKSKDILLKLNKIINQEKGVLMVKVSSAQKLHGHEKEEIEHLLKKRYHAHEILLEEHIDEKLFGGIRIEVEDEVIDLSLRNKINKLQEHLTRKV